MMARVGWMTVGFLVGVLGSVAAEAVWIYRSYPGARYWWPEPTP